MTGITVITATSGKRPKELDRCRTSVHAALGPQDRHLIIESDNYAQTKFDALRTWGYIGFVDDDDTIEPNALHLCREALRKHKVGCVTTDEVLLHPNGHSHTRKGPRTWDSVWQTVTGVHHLTVFDPTLADRHSLDYHNSFGVGIDWFIQASAAFKGGLVHIPLPLYTWTQTPGSMSKSRASCDAYEKHGKEMRALVKSWKTTEDKWVPQFTAESPMLSSALDGL